jgi:hypothetical protein
LGEDRCPLPEVRVELRSGNDAIYDQTNQQGLIRFEGLPAKSYTLSLCDLDCDLWEQIQASPLEQAESEMREPSWSTPESPGNERGTTHVVQSGECLSSIGFKYGFFPESLWALPENEPLRTLRKDFNILYPTDVVYIPVRRKKAVAGAPGNRYEFRRKGIPEWLRIRFLDGNSRPRAGLAYLLTITTRAERTIASVKGQTNGQGMLIEPIPPDADRAVLLAGTAPDIERMEIPIGRVFPIDTEEGICMRLANLGYFCGSPPGSSPEWTRLSIEQFQADNGLTVTGEADAPTKAKLVANHLS